MMTKFKTIRAALVCGGVAAALTGCSGGLFGGGKKTTPTVGQRTPILTVI